jgi:hypothetical protein
VRPVARNVSNSTSFTFVHHFRVGNRVGWGSGPLKQQLSNHRKGHPLPALRVGSAQSIASPPLNLIAILFGVEKSRPGLYIETEIVVIVLHTSAVFVSLSQRAHNAESSRTKLFKHSHLVSTSCAISAGSVRAAVLSILFSASERVQHQPSWRPRKARIERATHTGQKGHRTTEHCTPRTRGWSGNICSSVFSEGTIEPILSSKFAQVTHT